MTAFFLVSGFEFDSAKWFTGPNSLTKCFPWFRTEIVRYTYFKTFHDVWASLLLMVSTADWLWAASLPFVRMSIFKFSGLEEHFRWVEVSYFSPVALSQFSNYPT